MFSQESTLQSKDYGKNNEIIFNVVSCYRSSLSHMFYEANVLKIFPNFT